MVVRKGPEIRMAFHVASVLPLVCSLYLAQDGA
jgi:hypothetical protein